MGKYKVSAIVVAAGAGRRFGGRKKKQFLEFNGKPLFVIPVMVLEKAPEIKEIIVVLPAESIKFFSGYFKRLKIKKLKAIVAGGSHRAASVKNGLKIVSSDMSAVLIQDGVRPLLDNRYIKEGVAALNKFDGAVVGIPVSDTIKSVDKNHVVKKTVPRQTLWRAQTPQIFKANITKKAYKLKNIESFTDDSALVERMGGRIKMILGSTENIKITVSDDIKLLRYLKKGKI